MKINEILVESTVDEGVVSAVKNFGQNMAKGWAAAKTGYQSSQTSREQEEHTKKVSAGALQKWVAIDKNIKLSGQQSTPAQAVQWFTKFTEVAPTSSPANTSLNTMTQWVTKEISNFMANRSLGADATPASTATTPAAKVAKPVAKVAKPAAQTAALPTIGGIGPNDPRYAALAAKVKNAPATPGKFDWAEEIHPTDAATPAPPGWAKLKIPPSIQHGNESPYRFVNQKYLQDFLKQGWVSAK